jgi:uncharacterized cupin superfamily protein
MSNSILIAAAAATELAPGRIPRQWVLSGTPEARSKRLARTRDGTTSVWVWECSEGQFNWHYYIDETVFIICGEVFITEEGQQERRLGEGQMAYFPAGSSCVWRVTAKIKKLAFLRHDLPYLLGFSLRAWHALLQMARIRSGGSL